LACGIKASLCPARGFVKRRGTEVRDNSPFLPPAERRNDAVEKTAVAVCREIGPYFAQKLWNCPVFGQAFAVRNTSPDLAVDEWQQRAQYPV
jgi:hypothetical protein